MHDAALGRTVSHYRTAVDVLCKIIERLERIIIRYLAVTYEEDVYRIIASLIGSLEDILKSILYNTQIGSECIPVVDRSDAVDKCLCKFRIVGERGQDLRIIIEVDNAVLCARELVYNVGDVGLGSGG